jgi:MtfA peptidase
MDDIFIFLVLAAFAFALYLGFYIIAFIFMLLYNLFTYSDVIRLKFFNRFVQFYFDPRPAKLTEEQESYLEKHLSYFVTFPEKKKRIFKSRVSHFIKEKNFIGKEGLEVTEEMKVLTAASAVRLTFGLRYYLFEWFEHFMIYPHEYYSRLSKTVNAGQVSNLGTMVLSWKHLVYGYEHKRDNLNVGFHEFAHALYIEYQTQDGITDGVFNYYFPRWKKLVHDKSIQQKAHDRKVFADYAWTNDMEFFAVAMENFFETPDVFYRELPELFDLTCKLLNQNPLTFESEEV